MATNPLDEILSDLGTKTAKQMATGSVPPGTAAKFVGEAKAAIIALIREEIVGQDEKPDMSTERYSTGVEYEFDWNGNANLLRAKQRAKLLQWEAGEMERPVCTNPDHEGLIPSLHLREHVVKMKYKETES